MSPVPIAVHCWRSNALTTSRPNKPVAPVTRAIFAMVEVHEELMDKFVSDARQALDFFDFSSHIKV